MAPALVGENLFDHIRHMLWDTIPALVLSTILYWVIGMAVTPTGTMDTAGRDAVLTGLPAHGRAPGWRPAPRKPVYAGGP